ncbi:hypothetical protein [Paracoccus sp. ME4]|uniref:hypothetical protein n=1 Tax=Paracoccus sp. ME4 TaxID=3138066 RepID=UPI00398AB99F
MPGSATLTALAGSRTSAERIVDAMAESRFRVRGGEDELAKEISLRRRRAAGNSFGRVDPLLLEMAEDFDRLILSARTELGIASPTPADHLARLEENGPWLEDLGVTDSRTWEIVPTGNGRFAQVSHEFRMMSTVSFGSEMSARTDSMRRDEGVLRKMRANYEAQYPAPSDTPEP